MTKPETPTPTAKVLLMDDALCFIRDDNNRVSEICELFALLPRTENSLIPVMTQLRFSKADLELKGVDVTVGVKKAMLTITPSGYKIFPMDKFGDNALSTTQEVSTTICAKEAKITPNKRTTTTQAYGSTTGIKGGVERKKETGDDKVFEKTAKVETTQSKSSIQPTTRNRWEIQYPTEPSKILSDLFINFDALCYLQKIQNQNNYDVTLDVQVHQKDFIFKVKPTSKKPIAKIFEKTTDEKLFKILCAKRLSESTQFHDTYKGNVTMSVTVLSDRDLKND